MGCESFDIAVVGAGAAGQMAAIVAARAGRRVVVLEQMDRPGLKILASGGGRCNLTNLSSVEEFVRGFGRQGRFIAPAMEAMDQSALREFFREIGVRTVVHEGLYVYPASERSSDVQTATRRELERLGVTLRVGCKAEELWIEERRLAGVICGDDRIRADCVILACGGKSWPALGGTGGGYALARQAGMSVREPLPSLVGLVTQEQWPARVAGVSLGNARVRIDSRGQDRAGGVGDVLFTHRGLSGPAVLDISGKVSQLLHRGAVRVVVQPIADLDRSAWLGLIEKWRGAAGRRGIGSLLQGHLPRSLCAELCGLAGVDAETPAAQLTTAKAGRLAETLGGVGLTVTQTEGFDVAFVTRGGVDLKDVSPDDLQSRTLAGLYVAGEMLDLDGPTGGFNLQWAFASGFLAGRSAAAER